MGKTLILTGSFDIGEAVRDTQLQSLERAKQYQGDSAFLIGDLGVEEKITAYQQHHADGIREIYRRRLACAKSGCQISQLPKEEEIDGRVDFDALDRMVTQYEQANDEDTLETVKKIVDAEIDERLKKYGVDRESVSIIKERDLRAFVRKRIRSRNENKEWSWLKVMNWAEKNNAGLYLLLTELKTESNKPACRALMLALYQQIAEQGYDKLIILQEEIHRLSFENAQELYNNLHQSFPEDPRWQLQFENVIVNR